MPIPTPITCTTTHRPGKRNGVCFRCYDGSGRMRIQTYGRDVNTTLPVLIRYLGLLGLTLSDVQEVQS